MWSRFSDYQTASEIKHFKALGHRKSVQCLKFLLPFFNLYLFPQAVTNAVNSDEYIEKVRNAVYSSNINTSNNSSTGNNSSNDNTAGINLYLYGNVILDSNSVSDELDNSLNDVFSVEDNDISVSQTALSDDEVIACDINGKEYRASELVGKNIILEYYDKNDDKNVYFQGMYNEKFHWNGECVTNSYYKDGRFFGACEYTFDNGIRKNYKSIVATGETQWSYADKVCTDNGNEGELINGFAENHSSNALSIEEIEPCLENNLNIYQIIRLRYIQFVRTEISAGTRTDELYTRLFLSKNGMQEKII